MAMHARSFPRRVGDFLSLHSFYHGMPLLIILPHRSSEESARIFDKAAVRVRGDKAKLNFRYRDYVDGSGAIIPDHQVGLDPHG